MKKQLLILMIGLITMGQIFAAEETATIIILRPFDFGAAMGAAYGGKKYYAIDHYVYFDGQLFGSVPSMTYYEIEVEPGNHTLVGYTGQQGPDKAKAEGQKYSLIINAEANMTYYARINETKMKIELIEEKKWKKELTKANPVKWVAKLSLRDDVFYDANGNPVGENAKKAQQNLAQSNENSTAVKKAQSVQSDVDSNIPQSRKSSEDTYALIIANEEYQFVDPVNFASHDGEIFKEYCIKTLGIPEKQVRYCANASYGIISGGVDWLSYALNNFEGSKAIVYYCGHGIPDEKTGDAYIVPVDGKGTNTATCYSLNKLYTTLAATKAANITYFMDACFTGANKEGSMLVAARGVAREAKKEQLNGNAVVFSASSADETAMTYPEKGHGLFTYFLLKKLQETSGDVSYEELAGYINKNVKKEAFLINEKPQTPVVATSPKVATSWKTMKLK
ncbi:MAG: caspase family protein [Paludibacteraceae bacterium]|nr:caspase family protein [Paludibacteraceae bacterium]